MTPKTTDTSVIIPETRNTVLIEFFWDEKAQRVGATRLPVLAWHITLVKRTSSDDILTVFVLPISCTGEPTNTWCLECSDGTAQPKSWVFGDGSIRRSFGQALDLATEEVAPDYDDRIVELAMKEGRV